MKALIVYGGYEGHAPKEIAHLFGGFLKESGFDVIYTTTLDSLSEEDFLKAFDLIIPVWTMGDLNYETVKPIINAVKSGVGIAGCHGGMCDAFRDATDWQFMTGSQFVAHPGGDDETFIVNITDREHEITKGLKDFEIRSEKYYLHYDPSINILATTHFSEQKVDMPVVYTKNWGEGRVFYNSLGHKPEDFTGVNWEMTKRGLLWASRKS